MTPFAWLYMDFARANGTHASRKGLTNLCAISSGAWGIFLLSDHAGQATGGEGAQFDKVSWDRTASFTQVIYVYNLELVPLVDFVLWLFARNSWAFCSSTSSLWVGKLRRRTRRPKSESPGSLVCTLEEIPTMNMPVHLAHGLKTCWVFDAIKILKCSLFIFSKGISVFLFFLCPRNIHCMHTEPAERGAPLPSQHFGRRDSKKSEMHRTAVCLEERYFLTYSLQLNSKWGFLILPEKSREIQSEPFKRDVFLCRSSR